MPVWGLVLAFLTAAAWAVSPIFMKEGLKNSGPNEVNPVRSFGYLGTMILAMLLLQPGKLPNMSLALWTGLFINVGTSAVLGDQLYIYAIDRIGASLAVSISCGYPLATTAFSIWLLGEKITSRVWVGTILIIAGLIVIRYAAGQKEGEEEDAAFDLDFRKTRANKAKGAMFALVAALLWGANIPLLKKMMLVGKWTAVESYFLRSVVFFAVVWGVRALQHFRFKNAVRPLRLMPLRAFGAFMGSGVLGVALGGIAFAMCIQMLPVSVVTPITAVSPFITVLLCRVVNKEKLSRMQSIGVALVIAGSISVSL